MKDQGLMRRATKKKKGRLPPQHHESIVSCEKKKRKRKGGVEQKVQSEMGTQTLDKTRAWNLLFRYHQ